MWNDEDLHSYFSKNKSNIRETDFFFNGTFKSTFMKIANFCQLFAKTSILTRNNLLLIVVIESILWAVHDGQRNYHCQICDKRYKQLPHLKRHQEKDHADIHSKAKCEICETEFSAKFELTSHVMNYHHDISRKCEFCQKYVHQDYMKKHYQRVHRHAVIEL